MAQKPEIQYVGRFYVHGSEAKALQQEQQKKKAKTQLPQHRYERIRKVQVDLLAIGSILMAAVLLVTMVVGAMSMQSAWQELETARQYVYELHDANRVLYTQYRSQIDLEQVRSAALAMGLVPESELETMSLTVTMPEPQQEESWLESVIWSVKHMFEA